jgi:hypothetical protein
MSATANQSDRLVLPTRVRSRLVPDSGFSALSALAERFAELPFVQLVESAAGVGRTDTCAYFQPREQPARSKAPAYLFCRIGYNGISLLGLTDPERHQVLSRGWGRLDRQRVLLYLPRDESELAICWSILYRAYNSIINSPEQMSASPRAHFDDYPEPSHTSLV